MPISSGDEPVLIHNPRCSKSRAAKQLLEDAGVAFSIRAYLDEPLSRAELDELGRCLGKPAGEWLRPKEEPAKAAGLSRDSDDGAVKDAMAEHPILIERPILVRGERAVVGRPPEDVLELAS